MAQPSPTSRPWFRLVNAPLWAALLATLVCTLLYSGHRIQIFEIPGIDAWEQRSIDFRFRLRGPMKPKNDRIVIVGLDDRTRQELPDLWQNRRGFASLLLKIDAAKPRAFGIDAFFASPEINLSRATVDEVRSARVSLEAATSLSPELSAAKKALDLVDEETRGDEILATAVAECETLVLALLFYLEGEPLPPGSPERVGVEKARLDESVYIEQPGDKRPPQASGVVAPLGQIGGVVQQAGHVNVHRDSDGAVRKAPLVVENGGRFYQSLSLKLASMELGHPTSFANGDTFVSLGERRIPLDQQAFATIGYLGGNATFPRISAAEVMETEGGHPALRDKIVLLGYTDAARDKIITPLEQQLDGVELHATLVHNILHDELLHQAGPWTTVFAILAFGCLITLLQLRRVRQRGAWLVGACACALFFGYVLLCQYFFEAHYLLIEVMAPMLSALFVTLTALTVSLATEGREKAQLRSAFGQYLQSTLVERLIQDPERLKLGGERRELTVLFSDIRGFSRFSETLEPEVLSEFLNEYLTPMTELVMQDAGMLDKYIGDAVMAVYGAPVPNDDHAERACRTALNMVRALEPLNASWKKQSLPEIRIGIGINTGTMSVGNMGSERRFDYTVMGDAVNLGARLEGLTKVYGVNILVGEETVRQAGTSMVFREVDRVQVIGRSASASVYELCGRSKECPFSDDDLRSFAEALESYRARNWPQCRRNLESFLEKHPGDGPSQTLLSRLPELEAADLPPDWDGVFSQREK